MARTTWRWFGALLALGIVLQQLSAQDSDDKATAKPPEKPATHRVQPGPLRLETTLDGVFEARNMAEVILRPEEWTTFKVIKAVEQGTRVRKGDQLVWLETDDLDDAIREQESSHRIAELEQQLAEEEYQTLQKTMPFDLANAEHARQTAEEDLQAYVNSIRPLNEKTLAVNDKTMADFLEYAKEELRQLEKMYKADDLTEETEEIILKRARNDVEMSTFMVERNKILGEQQRKTLPRTEIQLREQARTTKNTLEKLRFTLPLTMSRTRLTLEKSKRAHQKSDERLAKLRKDRAAMDIVATADGIVYYGACDRGHWSGNQKRQFERGDTLPTNSCFMTIVDPRPLHAHASVPEKELHCVQAGVEGKAVPVGYPDLKFAAKVEKVGLIAQSGGTFDARFTVAAPAGADSVMPGMTCKITLVTYQKKDALTIPPGSLFTDEADPDVQYVYLAGTNGKHEKRTVKVGRKTDKKVEIVEGLKAGDEILLEEPAKK